MKPRMFYWMKTWCWGSGELGFSCCCVFLFAGERSQGPYYIFCYLIESKVRWYLWQPSKTVSACVKEEIRIVLTCKGLWAFYCKVIFGALGFPKKGGISVRNACVFRRWYADLWAWHWVEDSINSFMLCVLIYLGLFSLPCLLGKQLTAAHINGCKVTASNNSGF